MAPRSPDFKGNKTIPDLISDIRSPKLLPETGWYRVAITSLFEGQGTGGQYIGSTLNIFKNSWANVGGANAPASWYLSQNGEMRFRGKITGGAPGTVAFVLPEEIRPEYAETFITAIDGGGSATVTVATNGEVTIDAITETI